MGLVYLPYEFVMHVGKYTSPMDARGIYPHKMGYAFHQSLKTAWKGYVFDYK